MRRDRLLHDIGKAAGLEHAQRLVIERDRTRLVVDAGRALHDGDLQAVLRKQIGEDGADRPKADDRDVVAC